MEGERGDERALCYAPNSGVFFWGRREPEPDYVKLMPEYGVDVPLWGIRWETLHLRQRLVDRLRRWQEWFEDDFVHPAPPHDFWRDPETAAAWAEEGERLAEALREAVGPDVEVQVNLWPVTRS